MKLTVAAAVLLDTCIGKGASERWQRSAGPQNDSRYVSATFDGHKRAPGNNQQVERTTHHLRTAGAESQHTTTILLKNITTVRQHDVVECSLSSKKRPTVDVGILECGVGQYCMESSNSVLYGICVDGPTSARPFDFFNGRFRHQRSQRLLSMGDWNHHHREGKGSLLNECDPTEDTSGCDPGQHCVEDTASKSSGFCADLSGPAADAMSRFRQLQSGFSYTQFFDFIQYACDDGLGGACNCTSSSDNSTLLSCYFTPPCSDQVSPCLEEDKRINVCHVTTVEAEGADANDFEFNSCYGYKSPIDYLYCYQVVSRDGLISCTMSINNEQCRSCDLDPETDCIDFDCSNTPAGRAGSLCEDPPLGYPAFLDKLDCYGSCNICGEGGKLSNYEYDLSAFIGSASDCYFPLLCEMSPLSCEDAQAIALTGGLIGSDSCNIAPDVDVYAQCCIETPPIESPSSQEGHKGNCEDLNFDCFSCIGNGCYWCPGDALCSTTPIFVDESNIFDREHSCKVPEDYTRETCTNPGNFFSDPLYASQEWIFDMINIRGAWEKGYTGSGIHVRVNDQGIEADHPEFEGRIDFNASCPGQVSPPSQDYENGSSHGTIVASILGATAGNDFCGVGIAPEVTLSSCFINSEQGFAGLMTFKLETFDISQNSWGRETCSIRDERRRLQAAPCPFTYQQSHAFPCLYCDFNDPEKGQCIDAIAVHCHFYFREDRLGCLEHLDLTLGGNCNFLSLDDESREALTKGVVEGRDGKGVIFVFASGNSFGQGADTNFEGLGTNTRMAISVGAIGKDGLVAAYSTPGASLFVSAPGGDITNSVSNFLTASINGECGDAGEGTSFAAPVVSGVIALILEANPELTWRDVQAIIATTSQPVDDSLDDTAGINGAGLWNSNFYGFGIIDTLAAVEAAETWELIGAERMIVGQSDTLNLVIPDDDTEPVSDTLEISTMNPFVIESVYLYLRVEHSSRGHLLIKLISPSGTESILSPGQRPENTQVPESQWWKLMTLKFWGEAPDGEWTLSVVDLKDGDVTAVGSCADYEWLFMGLFNCPALETVQYCEDGQIDPYGVSVLHGDYDIIFSSSYHGFTAGEACCACGGGVDVNSLSDSLIEWKLAIYGQGSPEDDTVTLSPTMAQSVSPTLTPTPEDGTVTLSPTMAQSVSSTLTPTASSSPPPVSFPTSEPLTGSPTPFMDSVQISRIEATGDTYFYRNAHFQPSPDEGTMLVRRGKFPLPDAFAVVSFPFQNLGSLGLGESNFPSDSNTEIKRSLCMNHVQNAEVDVVSRYSLCRLDLDTIDTAQEGPIDLETYEGNELTLLLIPDNCMGGESDQIEFEVFSNDTVICVDVDGLLTLSTPLPENGLRRLTPGIEHETNTVMFMIDTLGAEPSAGDEFYTMNSDKPPELVVQAEVKDPNTPGVTSSPTENVSPTTSPTEDDSLTFTPTKSPTEKTSSPTFGNATQASPASGTDDPSISNKGLFGLLGLLLLFPLLYLCIFRKESDKGGDAQTESYDTTQIEDHDMEDQRSNVDFLEDTDVALVSNPNGGNDSSDDGEWESEDIDEDSSEEDDTTLDDDDSTDDEETEATFEDET